jgi:hypothetical protein
MKLLLAGVLLFPVLASFAQKVVDVDKADGVPINSFYTVNGSPVTNVRFVRLTDGTPYFKDTWMNSVATSDKNIRYQSRRVKLDLFDNEVHFLTDNEAELICTVPLKDITLTDTVTGASYRFVHSVAMPILAQAKKGWFLQLVQGKASLFQSFAKTLQEYKPYNSPVAEQKIITSEEFILAVNGSLYRPKKPKEIPELLPDKKTELEAFLKTDRLKSGSNAEKMAAMVSYYNSLQ